MAFTRSGVRSPSPPLGRTVGLSDGRPDTANDSRAEGPTVRPSDSGWSPRTGAVKLRPRGNSSVGRAQPCQGWGRGFESRFPLWKVGRLGRLERWRVSLTFQPSNSPTDQTTRGGAVW